MPQTCDLAPLTEFVPDAAHPWDRAAALHLHRRLGYGLAPGELDGVLADDPAAHVRARLSAAAALPPFARPPWHDWTVDDYTDASQYVDQVNAWRAAWIDDLRDRPWRAKLCLFWSGHFVTALEKYQCPSYMWAYLDVIQRHAFGDLREFVRAVGTTPAMLIYLDGVFNSRVSPNENYARELFELFTLGEGNGYTQSDVAEAARALTGYNGFTVGCAPIGYVPAGHDPGGKTIFGATAPFDYDGLVDHLFAARGPLIARHVCGRLYGHFVSEDPDAGVVAQLADVLIAADWRLGAVYERLFTSAHFFSPALRAVRIKDPLELLLGAERALATDALRTPELTGAIGFQAGNLGQLLFDPPDVAGWPGGREWVNANLLSLRGQVTQQILFLALQADRLALTAWARAVGPPDESDVDGVAAAIADFVLPKGLATAAEYAQAARVMRGEVPSYYYDAGLWDLDFEYAPEQVALLLDYLMRRPEYQLA